MRTRKNFIYPAYMQLLRQQSVVKSDVLICELLLMVPADMRHGSYTWDLHFDALY